jgi:hypothetical protein
MTKVEKIYSNKQLDLLRKEYDTLPNHQIKRLDNLFHLTGCQPKLKTSCVVDRVSLGTLISNYYLDYEEGSFACIHTDKDVKITAVTLLESENLEGGEIIVLEPFEKKHYVQPFIFENKSGEWQEGRESVPTVLPLKVGETAFLTTPYGITRVSKGLRRIHVGWWT